MKSSPQTLDRHQVRSLVKASLKIDWRGAINPFTGHSVKKGKIPGMAIIILLNLFISLFLGTIFIKAVDLLTGITVAGGTAMLIVAIQVLLEFGNIIISPDDYHVISPHPVNSKTFYIAKLAHLFLYVTLLSLTVSLGPAIFAAFRFDSLWAVPAVLIHFWICCVFVSALMMVLYTVVLKAVDRRRLEKALGYLHMIAILCMYLGLNVLPRIIKRHVFDLDIQAFPWLKFVPSYWFGAGIDLVWTAWDLHKMLFMLLGMVFLFILGRIAVSYLSLSYAESLVRTGWTRIKKKRSRLPKVIRDIWKRYSNPEDNALWLLVRANFKHDIQFRIGIMGYLPLMLFYLLYGFTVGGTNIRDPLAPAEEAQGVSNLLFGFVAVIAPFMLMGVMQTSKAWRAGWIFFATPIDRLRMVLAAEKLAITLLIPPLTILYCILYTILYGNPLHAIMHTIAMITVALTGITLLSIFNIQMPFSVEHAPGKMASGTIQPMFLSMFIFGVPIGLVSFFGYGGYWGWLIFVSLALLLNYLLKIGRVRRIRRVSRQWEFVG